MTHRIGLLVIVALALLATMLYQFGVWDRLRKRWRREIEDEESRKAVRELKTLGKSAGLNKVVGGLLIAAAKAMWSWRKAPDGSLQRLAWELVLLFGVAFALWVVLKAFDAVLNRAPNPLPDYQYLNPMVREGAEESSEEEQSVA